MSSLFDVSKSILKNKCLSVADRLQVDLVEALAKESSLSKAKQRNCPNQKCCMLLEEEEKFWSVTL